MGNMLRTTLYLASLTGLMLVVGEIFGGTGGLIMAFIFAALMNFGMYYYSDKIVLKMHNAKECHIQEINELVYEVAKKAGIPKPKVYIINQPTMNAFATGRDPKHAAVALTQMIVENLNKNQLRAVIGHELTHVKNRDTLISTLSATVAGAITMLTQIFFFTGPSGNENNNNSGIQMIAWLATLILAPIVAAMINLAVSRSREYAADEGGAKLTSKQDMVSALETISSGPKLKKGLEGAAHMYITNPFASGMMSELFSTHPPLYKRVQNIEKIK